MRNTQNPPDPFLKNDNNIVSEINRNSNSELIKKDPVIYSKTLSEKHKIISPKLGEDKTKITTKIIERDVPRSRIPGGARYDSRGNSVKMELGQYKIPFSGDSKLISAKFNSPNIYDFSLENQQLTVEIISFKHLTDNEPNKKEVTKLFLEFYEKLEGLFEEINVTVNTYNEKLSERIEAYLRQQIEEINKKNKNDNDLNPFL